MAEQSNADLIAEARDFVQMGSGINVMEADRLIEELARELEVADQRAVQAEAELKDAYRTDIPSLKEQRDELAAAVKRAENAEKDRRYETEQKVKLAAVIEQAEDYVTRHYLDTRFGAEVLPILATAPADALREVKAEAIREYVTAARENPHTYYWPPSGVLDDAEQWADEIEKGTI